MATSDSAPESGPDRPSGYDAWLTVGEAADAGNVSHRQIAAWIAAEKLEFRTGWRGGAEIRLVSLPDLQRLAPGLCLEPERGTLERRGVQTGPRRIVLGGSAPGRDSERLVHGPIPEPPPQGLPATASPEDRAWAADLEREVQRLRGVVRSLKADHDQLEAHLRQRITVVRTRGLDHSAHSGAPSATPGSVSPAAAQLAPEPGSMSVDVAHGQGPKAAPAPRTSKPLLTVAATLGGLALGWLGAASWARAFGSDRTVQASELPLDAAITGSRTGSVVHAQGAMPGPAPSPDAEDPSGAPQGKTRRARPASQPAAAALSAALAPPADPSTDSKDGRSHLTVPTTLAELDPSSFLPASEHVATCAYGDLIHSAAWNGGDHSKEALVLGPCFGPARRSDGRVGGTHRVDLVPCCRHHAFVERMTSASRDPAAMQGIRDEAASAIAEGVLPPLLRLRADRAATRFLRGEVGPWERAGLDGVVGLLGEPDRFHEWRRLPELEEETPGAAPSGSGQGFRLELRSWVVPMGEQGTPSVSAPFRMTVRVQTAVEGDVLESFQWENSK